MLPFTENGEELPLPISYTIPLLLINFAA